MRTKTGSYTGDGNNNLEITGVGFQPDVTIIKKRSFGGSGAVWHQASMGTDKSKLMTGSAVLAANLVRSTTSDGFKVGTDASVNTNTDVYDFICMKMDVLDGKQDSYSGDAVDSRSITGVGFKPEMVFVTRDGASETVTSSASHPSDDTHFFSTTSSISNAIQIPDETDGFQVGTDATVNASGSTYHYLCIKKVSGFFTTGTYVGDAVDNRSITGFGMDPDNAIIFRTSGFTGENKHWHPSSIGKTTDSSLVWTGFGNEANAIQKLQTDGIEIGTLASVNVSSSNYVFYGLKDGDSKAFGDIAEALEVGSASASSLTLTYASATPAVDDLNIANHFTGNGTSDVDTAGYVEDLLLSNLTEDDQGAIYSQLVTGAGDDTVTCSSPQANNMMLQLSLIRGAFESSPKDLSDDSGRATVDPSTTGVSASSTAQADEFMNAILCIRNGSDNTDAWVRLGTATPTSDMTDYSGAGVSGQEKRLEGATQLLTAIGTVGVSRANTSNFVTMIGYVTYKKKAAAPVTDGVARMIFLTGDI